ncbi:MAG: DegT/DnrJ/EryC1/StrS family aminotransferase [Planctomycetota bacterium]
MIPFQNLKSTPEPIQAELERAMQRVTESGIYLRGMATRDFEERWAEFCGQRYCIGLANGTDAVTLIALAADLQEMSVPAITCRHTAEGLHRAACRVRPIDVTATGKLNEPNQSTICVPLYGSFPSIEEAEKCRFFDAAQAHGWRPPQHATVAWSFYPTKTLGAMGDCGAVTTNDQSLAESIRVLAGRDDQFRSRHQIVSRIDELQAAILTAKLTYLTRRIEQRKQIADWYTELLAPSSRCHLAYKSSETNVYSMAVMADRRDELQLWLKAMDIECKAHYPIALHQLDAAWSVPTGPLPMAERWCNRTLSLPCFPGLRRSDVHQICDSIHQFYEVHA